MDWKAFTEEDLKAATELEGRYPVSAGRGKPRAKAGAGKAAQGSLVPAALLRVRKANRDMPKAQVLKRSRRKAEKQAA